MSGILLHLHFKPDKIIFRVDIFPWRQLQIEYFFPCYLFLPFQSNFTFGLQIPQCWEKGNDPLLPFFPPRHVERLSFAFLSRVYTYRKPFASTLKYLHCPYLTSWSLLFARCYQWMSRMEDEVKRDTLIFGFSESTLHLWPSFSISFKHL